MLDIVPEGVYIFIVAVNTVKSEVYPTYVRAHDGATIRSSLEQGTGAEGSVRRVSEREVTPRPGPISRERYSESWQYSKCHDRVLRGSGLRGSGGPR